MADKTNDGGWIQGAIRRPGEFARKAEERGLAPVDFQEKVLTNPNRYDQRTVKQARLRKTLSAISQRRKKNAE